MNASSYPLSVERSISPQNNSSISLRSPSFNISTIRSPDFLDKTVSTKRVMESPFYRGRTIYGGASTYGSRLSKSPSDLKHCLKESVRIKPANIKHPMENATLSRTAQRILNTLEQYTTPVRDAKKIPASTKGSRQSIFRKYVSSRPYCLNEHKQMPNTQLQIPAIPDLLRMKQKLQSSTVMVKQIADASNYSLNNDAYVLKTSQEEKPKYSNKIKTKIAGFRQKIHFHETAKYVDLNPVALPITTLPTFDLTRPLLKQPLNKNTISQNISPVSHISHTECKRKTTNSNIEPKNTINYIEYRFSKPLVIAENLRSITAVNNFRFSKPLPQKQSTPDTHGKELSYISDVNENIGGNTKTMNKKAKTGFIFDYVQKDVDMTKFLPRKGMWECSTCLVLNKSEENRCVACTSVKPVNKSKLSSRTTVLSNLDQQWCLKCKKCNNVLEEECPVCKSQRSLTHENPFLHNVQCCIQVNNTISMKDCTCKSRSDVMLGRETLANMWECPNCLIKNSDSLLICAACETPKPKDVKIPLSFKPPNNTWECPTCLIRNADEKTKCIACETAKPINKVNNISEKHVVSNNTGQCSTCLLASNRNEKCADCKALLLKPNTNTENGKPFSFGDTWTCPSCMVQNTNEKCTICQTIKPIKGECDINVAKLTFNPPSNTWKCPTCLIRNADDNATCLACETKKPLDKSLHKVCTPGTGGWECASCLVRNDSNKTKCVCCETPKPTTEKMYASGKVENAFNFGINTQENCSVMIGSSTGTTSQTITLSTASSTNTGNFVFGIANVNKNIATEKSATTTAGFNFGSSQIPNFTFGTNLLLNAKNIDKSEGNVTTSDINTPPTLGFQFVANSEVMSDVLKKNGVSTVNSVTTETPLQFNLKTPISGSKIANPKENSLPLFNFISTSSNGSEKKTNVTTNTLCTPSTSILGNSNSYKTSANASFNYDEPPKKMAFPPVAAAPTTLAMNIPKAGLFTPDAVQNCNASNGGLNTSNPPASSIFSFTAKSNTNPLLAPSTQANVFNTNSTAATSNESFNFTRGHINSTSQKTGFNFGAVQAQQSRAGYNFTAPVTPNSTGGFNFNLDPNAKLSFNFTGDRTSSPVFTAPPVTEAIVGSTNRKMKRAKRRTTPR